MLRSWKTFLVIIISVLMCLLCCCPVYAGEVVNPAEDREIVHNNGDGTTTLINDGQWWPLVKFDSGGTQAEGQLVTKYDLSAYRGLQFVKVSMHFYVERARNYKTLGIDTMFYEGNGTITTYDFDQGTNYVGTFTFDIPAGIEDDYSVEQWVEYDVTELVNNRNGDYVYFSNRLSGGYPNFSGNVFADTSNAHWINLAAVENSPSNRPFLEMTNLFVCAGPDRRVYGEVNLDGSDSSDPDHDIVFYAWSLKCRGNNAFDKNASGAQVTISNLKPGFYDGNLTITNDQGEQGTATFVVFSGIGPQGDYNGDGDVDGADLPGFAGEFGQ